MVGLGVSQEVVVLVVVICIVAAVGRRGVAAGRPAAEQRGDGRRPAFEPGTYLCSQFSSHPRPIATGVDVPVVRPHSFAHSLARSLTGWPTATDCAAQDWLSQSQ